MLIEMKESVSGLWQDACNFVGEQKNKIAGVAGGSMATFGSAFAAVPTEVTTAIADMKADALTVGAAFVVAVIALKALHLMKRA